MRDRADIEALLVRYATAVDGQDWALLDGVFTPDARLDFGSVGGPACAYPEARAWLEESMAGFRILQHFVSNVRVELLGEEASARSYVLAKHGYKRGGAMAFFEMGGEYRDRLVRGPEGWRIRERTLAARWFEGDLPDPR